MNPKVSKTSRREYMHLSEEFIPATYIFYKLKKAVESLKTLSCKAEEQIFPFS